MQQSPWEAEEQPTFYSCVTKYHKMFWVKDMHVDLYNLNTLN